MTIQAENEMWDLYTKDREKTGRLHRRGDAMKNGEYHLAIHVCIFNSRNELLIQQRQSFKEDWPDMWDLTAAGSALQGENSCQAAEREVAEELGLKIDLSDRLADFTIITSDNPRFEEPLAIIEDIKVGMQKTEGAYMEIPDRKEAIRYAVTHGEPGDIVVLAGKGHEDYQEIKGVQYPMDERVLIAEILEEEGIKISS